MATHKYKFILLKDPDISSHQSRGLSLQVNGFAPLYDSKGKIAYGLSQGTVPDITELVAKNDVVLLFRDVKYVTNSGVPSAADVNYSNYKSQPGLHMFQGVIAEAADELAYDTEEGTTQSQIMLQFPLYSSMFGSRVQGDTLEFNGIVLYGQAYNPEFLDETAQGKLQDAVPIGLIWFDKPYEIDLSMSDTATSTTFRIAIGLRVGTDITESYIQANSAYAAAYSAFQGSFHVVNNNMTTSSAFVLRGRDVIPLKDSIVEGYERVPLPEADATIDFASRVFFTNEPPGNDNDHNVDFGSPARLTVFNTESACSGTMRIPQTLIGKVSYTQDEDLYKHAYWDGVAESYYAAAGRGTDGEVVSGSCYDIDWISKKKPAVSIFSTDNEYVCKGDYAVKDIEGNTKSIFVEADPGLSYGKKFANGANIFSRYSSSVADSINVNTTNSNTRGNAMVLNSTDVETHTRIISEQEWEDNGFTQYRYDTFIANSQEVGIFTEVKGRDNREKDIPNQLNTIVGSKKVRILSLYERDGQKADKNLILGCTDSDFEKIDNTQFIGCTKMKANDANYGTYIASTGSHSSNAICENNLVMNSLKSDLKATTYSTAIGGAVFMEGASRCFSLSTATQKDDYENRILKPTSNNFKAIGCFIFGLNNTIEVGEANQYNVYVFGKGLTSDPRVFSARGRSGDRYPTYILGRDNSKYYQQDTWKSIVIGGRYVEACDDDANRFRYNSLEHYIAKTADKNYKGQATNHNVESVDSLTDVKGRKIKYTSNGIELSFLNGDRNTDNYDNYVFKGCGRINLFKLYQLLHRMYWDYDGTVKFDWLGTHPGTTNTWLDQKAGWHSWDINGDTNLANLVDDHMACFPYAPSK